MSWPGIDLASLVETILAQPGRARLVAVDGRGGAGKTTFAAALAEAAGGVPVFHTDDYAARNSGRPWWPELLREVVDPVAAGDDRFVEHPIVIIEGVSAGRREWERHLRFVIWVETPTAVRRQRMLHRDGTAAADHWADYEAEETAFFAADPVRERADIVIETA